MEDRDNYVCEKKFPFNSERKRMSTIIHLNGKKVVLLKGASEIVLESCNKWILSSSGEVKMLTEEIMQEMKDSIVNMAKKSLRTLCFAYK